MDQNNCFEDSVDIFDQIKDLNVLLYEIFLVAIERLTQDSELSFDVEAKAQEEGVSSDLDEVV